MSLATLPQLMVLGVIIARLAQSAERKALNLVVVGSSPTVGVEDCCGSGAAMVWCCGGGGGVCEDEPSHSPSCESAG